MWGIEGESMDYSSFLLYVIPLFMVVYGIYLKVVPEQNRRRFRIPFGKNADGDSSMVEELYSTFVFSIGAFMTLALIVAEFLFFGSLEPESPVPMIILAVEIALFLLAQFLPSFLGSKDRKKG